ncbi:MAG: hypothetical protein A3F33_00665 [Candidatus Woykebacteria bacterium RIFCSPHIGHO2_12_FULL_43_10]|uniref:Phosphoribulokinase/uridine kinase domain-containing protein n=2 Tax=Candidatus Woykeibacteriota TaxID=1817899 RepID=A0A1G1WZ03_9BACT|nr:MAG: hypothetical protein A2802_02230 [Candidatus Woykebacteria bacterium RIFCSPHIGHO2_01_FULL_43_29]OGY28664.1 MAG: hypothetical protein A3F33_00665 [Candidatus Woykebacteria bacterium RIFCSPHIGHO2_12_FULL_43_10]OGY29708.1 MAG: hypothetical protein A3J50_02085 [Candidatus Woykebacteria bacterium RIFCSPHIGHO2_02_FULL_43_16b]OGY32791.1 MAG: hypothetical protein A3A61_03300 [Candidatus Woykebacteria bacterium RIFCSPLOWO2_01_FULL_43_14]
MLIFLGPERQFEERRIMKKGKVIAAICGPSCSGKTETSVAAAKLDPDVRVYPYDEHDLYPSNTPELQEFMARGGPPHWEARELFDTPAFVQNVRRWHDGLPVCLPANSRESMATGLDTRIIAPGRINIVEGVHVLSFPELIPLYDATFFIEISLEEMVKRRLARHPGSLYPWDLESYITGPLIQGTLECVMDQKPRAQYQLDGTKPFEELAQEVLRIMTAVLQG